MIFILSSSACSLLTESLFNYTRGKIEGRLCFQVSRPSKQRFALSVGHDDCQKTTSPQNFALTQERYLNAGQKWHSRLIRVLDSGLRQLQQIKRVLYVRFHTTGFYQHRAIDPASHSYLYRDRSIYPKLFSHCAQAHIHRFLAIVP